MPRKQRGISYFMTPWIGVSNVDIFIASQVEKNQAVSKSLAENTLTTLRQFTTHDQSVFIRINKWWAVIDINTEYTFILIY